MHSHNRNNMMTPMEINKILTDRHYPLSSQLERSLNAIQKIIKIKTGRTMSTAQILHEHVDRIAKSKGGSIDLTQILNGIAQSYPLLETVASLL